MPVATNSLVSKVQRNILPTGAALVFAVAASIFFHQKPLHAAGVSSPLDDTSVSSLVALDNAVESVAARVSPAVVNIAVASHGSEEQAGMQGEGGQQLPPGFAQFFGPNGPLGSQGGRPGRGRQQGQQQLEHGVGSGIIISSDGYIVTNDHVVDGAVQIKVTLNDRRILNAKLIGTDKLTDLAVIKVDASGLPSLSWGDSTTLKAGQTVLAFGSPFGYFQNSVTRGIVSAVNRQNPYSDDARKPGAFIQTDAAINPGNSGGALVNAHGELIGINTFIISNSGSFAGAGFAIPSQIARVTAAELIKSGTVHHGYLGISMNDVTPENAGFFHLKDATGAIVAQVTPDSPASRAGLQNGDVIAQLDGQKIVNGSALQVAVSEDRPGTTIALGILRDGAAKTVNVTVGEFRGGKEVASAADPAGSNNGKLGLAVDDLNSDVRQQLGVPAKVNGVAVAEVRPGSPAEDAGLTSGDVILEVNRKGVGSAAEFVKDVRANPAGKDILLLVWQKGNAGYVVVHPGEGGKSGM